MLKARLFDISLFLTALAIAFSSDQILINHTDFIKILFVFWLFSSLYYHLRVFSKNGSTNWEHGISYDISFAMVAGPLGLFIFEFIYRFTVYFYKKWTKTADPNEFLDTLYNIGSFVITNSIAYFLFLKLHSTFEGVPFGFWILMCLLVSVSSILSSIFLVLVFYIVGDFKTVKKRVSISFLKAEAGSTSLKWLLQTDFYFSF
jgi:hypothetical protein